MHGDAHIADQQDRALRERVAAIEAHVGLGDASEEVVADD